MPVPDPAVRGFTASADLYEARRPGYPEEALRWLSRELRLGPSSRVLDVGAGTGKLTRQLMAVAPAVVAVEPLEAMAAQFAAVLDAPICRAVVEALPVWPASVDAVVVGQAFHWFDFAAALAELHRVLRPGGGLGLIWNMRDEGEDWVARLGDIRRRYGDIAYDSGQWRVAVEASALFGPLVEAQFAHQHVLEPEGVVELMASRSFIAALPPEENQAVRDEIRALLASHANTRGRRVLTVPYRTDVYWTRRADAQPSADAPPGSFGE